MVCENCGSGNAVIHLTQIVDQEMRTLHLCEECAAEKGLETSSVPQNFPLTDFLAQMGGKGEAEGASGGTGEERETAVGPCSFCGLEFSEFKETGRLGCPHCWSSFELHLRGLLRRVHGGSQHLGKVYLSPDPSVSEREQRLEALRRKLRRAVELEDFEKAADLRDEIRTLEPAAGR
jgi:protein arginine kinase activator